MMVDWILELVGAAVVATAAVTVVLGAALVTLAAVARTEWWDR